MIRKLGCLSALLSLFFFVVVVGAIGWFGYQAYVHATNAQAIATRTDTVGRAWTDDPVTLANAATGKGGLLPRTLSPQPFQQLGAVAADGYTVSKNGTTVTLTTTHATCQQDRPERQVEVVETPVLVQVLVRTKTSWLPDVAGIWHSIRPEPTTADCTIERVETLGTVQLSGALGRRPVIDATSGKSVGRS